MHTRIILKCVEKYKCPGIAFSRAPDVSDAQPCLKTTRLYDDLLLLSILFHFFYFILSVPISLSFPIFSNSESPLLLLTQFNHVQLCVTPYKAAHQAPLSLGSSRQEYWSGLPFPSPMHESESEFAQLGPTPSDPMDCRLPGSSIHGIFQARVLEWGAIAFSILIPMFSIKYWKPEDE